MSHESEFDLLVEKIDKVVDLSGVPSIIDKGYMNRGAETW
jgi:hypothetical protein